MNSVNPTPPYADWASAARTIQDAVDATHAGDLVLVTNGVYTAGGRAVRGSTTINRVAIDRTITVQSVNGPEVTVIDGAATARCAYVTNNVVLSGFTLTNGLALRDYGGGVLSEVSGVVSNCVITGNRSGSGGGSEGGILYNCTLSGNSSRYGGGADYAILHSCMVSGNDADYGGGANDCTLYNCALAGNESGYSGGGAWGGALYNCTLTGNMALSEDGGGAFFGTLSNCILTGNSALVGGGAFASTLDNCRLSGNSADVSGGAQDSTLYSCTVTGNSAMDGTGGAGLCTLYNCTVTDNSAEFNVGGAYGSTLYNCIVYYNSGPSGPNYEPSSTLNYCCTTPIPSTGTGNIDQEPGFVNLAGGDYHLESGSLCINAGTNQNWMIGATDLDGKPRVIRGVVDMGAYEFQLYDGIDLTDPIQALADLDGDKLSNLMEYALANDPRNPADAQAGLVISIIQDAGGHYASLRFRQQMNGGGLPLQYFPEVSGDKQTWFSDGAHVMQVGVTPLDNQFTWVTVRDSTPITPTTSRFMRLRVISGAIETTSPVSVSTATTIQGNSGSGYKCTTFSQRMVLPIQYAGIVSSLHNATLTDSNASWADGQFGTNGTPSYVEFDNGWIADIAYAISSTKSLALAGNLGTNVAIGDAYRIRPHFTVASLFGTNNEAGLRSGGNTAQADNIMVLIPQTRQTLTIFYYDDGINHGWLTGGYTPADNTVVYPEQGLLVRRSAAGDRDLYLCGPVKSGVMVAPIQPGYNLVGTLKSLNPVSLGALNLYTGDPTTGLASGGNTADTDTLLLVQPDGTAATYFYYKDSFGNAAWLDANYNLSANVLIYPGNAFFIHRLTTNGAFNWTMTGE